MPLQDKFYSHFYKTVKRLEKIRTKNIILHKQIQAKIKIFDKSIFLNNKKYQCFNSFYDYLERNQRGKRHIIFKKAYHR